MARAASAYGAHRMAVSLAHEAAQIGVAQSANGVSPPELVELTVLWREATAGLPLGFGEGAAGRPIWPAVIVGTPKRPRSG